MSRRTAIRIAAAFTAAFAAASAVGLAPASPASAHGAPVQPISRTVACAPDNADARTAACKAALKANGRPFGQFDNLRVAGVNGKDRSTIPDGKLCSGAVPEFKGLDLARDDWPATRLTAGATLTMRYRGTIPHEGVFRIYLTKPGYDPDKSLGWDDLAAAPIIIANNPPLRDGSYRISGKLPKDRAGRHVLYTVWQTTSTPDTYYSCSDVIFPAAAAAARATPKPKATSSRPARSGAVAAPSRGTSDAPGAVTTVQRVAANAETTRRELITTLVVIILGMAGVVAFFLVRRARRDQRIHRRSPIR